MKVTASKRVKIGALILTVTMTAGLCAAKENLKNETESLKKSFPNL